jgi:hypothetical protein
MPAVLEILFVEPHAVHDDRELARDGNAGLLHTNPFAELEAPRPQRRPLLGDPQVGVRGFVECMPHEPVAAPADVARKIELPRSIDSGVSPKCAATAFEFLKRVGSSMVALNARLTIGPTPDMVISLRQTSSLRATCERCRSSTTCCRRMTLRASRSGSIATRSSELFSSRAKAFAAKVQPCTWPSFNPYTFNKPRIVCSIASIWITNFLRAISVVRRSCASRLFT